MSRSKKANNQLCRLGEAVIQSIGVGVSFVWWNENERHLLCVCSVQLLVSWQSIRKMRECRNMGMEMGMQAGKRIGVCYCSGLKRL